MALPGASTYSRRMAENPPSAVQFMSSLLGAVHEVTGRRPPPTWAHVDKVQSRVGIANRDAVDAGIRLAVAKGWLRADGDPPTSVTLTVDGVKLLAPKS
jgi:hypothetical protein